MPRGKYRRRDKAIYEVPPPGSRVLVYVRFSGEDQDASSQEAAIRRWVTEERGWTVYPGGWFVDEARSGSSTEGRDQFQAMIRLAERLADVPDRPAGVVIWKFNRFGRDLLDNEFYKAHLRRLGYALVSMADDIPQSDFAPVVEALLDWKAQRDLEDISSDVRRAFADLRAQGYRTGGFPPRGLMAERTVIGTRKNGQPRYGLQWVPDPVLAPRVVQAFEMRADGSGYAAILRGPLCGVYKTTGCLSTFFGNRNYADVGVITEELFQRVQAVQLRFAHREGTANPKSVGSRFLLTGLLECRCGAAMVGETKRGRYRYYRCGQRMRERGCACTQPRVSADKLEVHVLDDLLACVLTPARLTELTELVNHELNGDDELQAEADRLRRQMADVEAVIARLLDALEREGLESVKDRLKLREEERRKLRDELLLVEAEIRERRPTVLTPQEVVDLLDEIRRHREAEDVLELRAILRLVVDRVVVDGQDCRIRYKPEAQPWFT